MSAEKLLARAMAVACTAVLGLVATGCGGGRTASPEGKCIDWIADVQEGNVAASAEFSELVGSVDESDLACSRASQLELIGDDGSLTLGALRLVAQCESYSEACYRPGSEQQLIDDPRFQRLSATDRLVLLVGYLRYADLDGEARPSTFVGNPFRDGKRLEGVAAWSHDAGLPPSAVRSAIAAGISAGLVEERKERVIPPEPCSGGVDCETVYRFVRVGSGIP